MTLAAVTPVRLSLIVWWLKVPFEGYIAGIDYRDYTHRWEVAWYE